MTPKELETEVMAYRYLYYVLAEPVLSDHDYDVLERKVRAVLPSDSPVQGVGSSLSHSYTQVQINRAEDMLNGIL
jgi:NAD-dependent DNA ligase